MYRPYRGIRFLTSKGRDIGSLAPQAQCFMTAAKKHNADAVPRIPVVTSILGRHRTVQLHPPVALRRPGIMLEVQKGHRRDVSRAPSTMG